MFEYETYKTSIEIRVVSLRYLKSKNILLKLVPFFFFVVKDLQLEKKVIRSVFPICLYFSYALKLYASVFTNTNSILLPECWPARNLNSFCYRWSGCLVDFSCKYHGMYYYNFEKRSLYVTYFVHNIAYRLGVVYYLETKMFVMNL